MQDEKVEEIGFGEVETEGFEGNLEFMEVNATIFVYVEEGESLVYLVPLLLC